MNTNETHTPDASNQLRNEIHKAILRYGQERLEPARTVPGPPESKRWLKEAEKIIAAYPEKHRARDAFQIYARPMVLTWRAKSIR